MSVEDRLNAVAKNIEGKVQEAMSEVTGNPKDKVEGQMKQEQAAAMHAKEDLKDRAKGMIDRA
ncbi:MULTISPECIES: CsbD family protein [Oscillatoriophycideae]|uniref:CsbD family protein n=1 Tax=Aerosakkonema funiforme FACHB-1375 TaxID=2949571 RepID=A0A926ZH29_9CYAN|nr:MULTISPECIES: CsbD family protein [Oscillatoriales]MBD2182199.1 CsbD family protein [Aerosakkonema funiforme FACHB-1375]MBD3558673.1 CsbD family protein [Planktothrix sp. FACHB-1355]